MTKNSEEINGSLDRLSFLPNDILIEIISRLPLGLAIATGTLSRRWRGLWTNTTSIDIFTYHDSKLREFDTTLNEILMQISSPFINSFRLVIDSFVPNIPTLIRKICERNIHQLRITWAISGPYIGRDMFLVVPIVIFQTQSLVSIELGSSFGHSFELPDDCEIINLPNLKKLSLQFVSFRLQWIEKLIKACPSLQVLYLTRLMTNPRSLHQLQSLKCCNQSLRWLFLRTNFTESNSIVIKAPKLDISAPKPGIFSFEEQPIALREVKIKFTNDVGALFDEENGFMSKFYRAVSNVRFLTLNISKVDNLSWEFRYATRLTFDMNVSQSLKTMSSLFEMCPVVDFWTVDVLDTVKDNEQSLLRALKRIHIDIWRWDYSYDKPAESFLDLIAYLLRNAPNLEHLNLSVNSGVYWLVGNDANNEARELMLSKLLFQCPMASTSCNVEFKGRYVKMSRKDCPS